VLCSSPGAAGSCRRVAAGAAHPAASTPDGVSTIPSDPSPSASAPPDPFILGWEEWLSLPELGLPAIKAKVDTGARTSALHAFLIEPFGTSTAPMVRFGIHPIPGRNEIEIYCSAPVLDRREVTSSNGERETRFVIVSRVRIGERDWPIEITLTNRESMSYRMLLGRQAIREDMFVDPAASFRQPRLSYKLYRHLPKQDTVRRALRIAVLTRKPEAVSNRLLTAAAAARGHTLELIDAANLTLAVEDGAPAVLSNGTRLAHYDAVIPRSVDRMGAAIVRQFELMGSTAINSGDALDRLANPIAAVQALIRMGVPTVARELRLGKVEHSLIPPRTVAPLLEATVIGGATVALAELRHKRMRDVPERRYIGARRLAERAARALRLGLARVEMGPVDAGFAVVTVSAQPSLSRIKRVSGVQAAEAVIAHIEREVRSWVRREEPQAAEPAALDDDSDRNTGS
jgi:hypothetical protein